MPKIDETRLQNGVIRLNRGFIDTGTGSVRPGRYWVFETEVATGSQFTLTQPPLLYDIVDRNRRPVGGHVFASIPGLPGYSPYWQVYELFVPDNYVPNSIRTLADIQTALQTPGFRGELLDVAVNCPVVGESATLEGNPGSPHRMFWYEGRRGYYYAFDNQRVVNGRVQTAPLWAFLARGFDPNNPGSPNGQTTTQPLTDYYPARALPLPYLNQDQGIGNGILINNILNTFPHSNNPANPNVSTHENPETGAYSSLWTINNVSVPDGYRFRSVNTLAGLAPSAGFTVTGTNVLVNCPLFETLQP